MIFSRKHQFANRHSLNIIVHSMNVDGSQCKLCRNVMNFTRSFNVMHIQYQHLDLCRAVERGGAGGGGAGGGGQGGGGQLAPVFSVVVWK